MLLFSSRDPKSSITTIFTTLIFELTDIYKKAKEAMKSDCARESLIRSEKRAHQKPDAELGFLTGIASNSALFYRWTSAQIL